MYQITKRITDGSSTVIGYVLSENGMEKRIPKNLVLSWAKSGLIQNVRVSGDSLSGTNGFELKKLPTIKDTTILSNMPKDNTANQTILPLSPEEHTYGRRMDYERWAALIRHIDDMGIIPKIGTEIKRTDTIIIGEQLLQQELKTCGFKREMAREFLHMHSKDIKVTERIENAILPALYKYFQAPSNISKTDVLKYSAYLIMLCRTAVPMWTH